MEYIIYNQKYEKDVVALWNKALFLDQIDVDSFRNKTILDENYDSSLCYLALDNDKVVGYILGMKRKYPYLEKGLQEDLGWISVMFVDKEYQNKGIGEKLYLLVETRLKELGAKKIILASYSPNYFFAGIDETNYPEAKDFFTKMGYVKGENHYSMGKDLSDFKMSDEINEKYKALMDKGYKLINFDYSYALELIDFLTKEFPGGWKKRALLSMSNKTAEDLIILVLDKDDKVCGFSMRAIDGNLERFGPIGIAEEKRNEGIGSVLLNFSFNDMHKKGINRMFFMTTDEPGKRYYERNGLSLIRIFTDYHKDL